MNAGYAYCAAGKSNAVRIRNKRAFDGVGTRQGLKVFKEIASTQSRFSKQTIRACIDS